MIRPITIGPVLNGYIVGVGCQTIVLQSRESLLHELKLYLDNPEQTEKHYLANAVNVPSDPSDPSDLSVPQPPCNAQMEQPATVRTTLVRR